MCLILFAYKKHPNYRLILAANRDEFYDRPAAPLHEWKDHPEIVAGRDLKSNGTWMGVARNGRLAAVTNYRDPGVQVPDAISRGQLITDFLTTDGSPGIFIEEIQKNAHRYNGFNLLVGDMGDLVWFSNRGSAPVHLDAGIYGLSNRLLDTNWPKVAFGKYRLTRFVNTAHDISRQGLLEVLKNQTAAPDDELPETGVGLDLERLLSPVFITSPNYGTRCSTILTMDRSNRVVISEYSWEQGRSGPVVAEKHRFDFVINQ